MSQLPLFKADPPPPRPADPAFIRKHLMRLLRLARNAEIMPWRAAEANKWERQFPRLADNLPQEEADELRAAFAREMARLRSKGKSARAL